MRRRARPKLPTKGHRLFAALFTGRNARSQSAVAAELGVGQQTVSEYASGRVRPGELVRIRCESRYGIPRESWLTAEERRYLATG